MFTSRLAQDILGAIESPECQKLAELANGKEVLEIGSQHGSSTVAMARTAIKVVAVDWHQGDDHASRQDTLGGFWQNLHRYKVVDKVIPVIAKIEDVNHFLRLGSFDMAFIDAQHYYEDARHHILIAFDLVKPDGLIVVHDYGWHAFPGVKKAVDELVERPQVFGTLAIFRANQIKV